MLKEWALTQLGQAAGLHRARLRRLLEAQGVAFEERGRALVVRTSELKEKTPKFWRSLEAVIGWAAQCERAGPVGLGEGSVKGTARRTGRKASKRLGASEGL